MAHFHFNFRSPENMVLDEEGVDLLDVGAAREEALASAREILANAIKTGTVPPPYSIVITDASGRAMATITVKDVFQS